MTAEQFIYWLQGFFELNKTKTLNEVQTECVKEHLSKCFNAPKEYRYNDLEKHWEERTENGWIMCDCTPLVFKHHGSC